MDLNRTTWSLRFLSHKVIDWGPFMKLYFCHPTTLSHLWSSVVCRCSVAHSCPTLCEPMDCSTPDLLVLHYLPEFAQLMSIDSVTPPNHLILCYPLLLLPSIFPNIKVFSMSRLLTSGGQNIGASASISLLPMNIQSRFPLGLTGLSSLLSKVLSCVFSSTTVQKHQFFSAQPSLWSNSDIHTWLLGKPQLWVWWPLLAKWCLCFLIHCLGLVQFSSHEQESFNLMTAVSVLSDFGAQENKMYHYFHFFPHLFAMKWWDQTLWS